MLSATAATVWAGTCEDRPGQFAHVLEELAKAGASLEFVQGRRFDAEPGKGIFLVSPLRTPREIAAAERLGMAPLRTSQIMRVEGFDEPGMAYQICRALAAEGINLNEVTLMSVRQQFVGYFTLANAADAGRAIERMALCV